MRSLDQLVVYFYLAYLKICLCYNISYLSYDAYNPFIDVANLQLFVTNTTGAENWVSGGCKLTINQAIVKISPTTQEKKGDR